jgi:hypothetical protein
MAKIAKQTNDLKLSEELINSLVLDDELSKLLGIEKEEEKKQKEENIKKDRIEKKIIK